MASAQDIIEFMPPGWPFSPGSSGTRGVRVRLAFRPFASAAAVAAAVIAAALFLWSPAPGPPDLGPSTQAPAASPGPRNGSLTGVLLSHQSAGSTASPLFSFSVGSHTVAAGSLDSGVIDLWNTSTGKLTTTLSNPGTRGAFAAVTFSPNGETLATGDGNGNGTVQLWDLTNSAHPRQIGQPLTTNSSYVNSVTFSPNGETLAVGDGNGSTYLWDTVTERLTTTLSNPDSQGVDMVAFPTGTTIAAGDGNGNVYLWGLKT